MNRTQTSTLNKKFNSIKQFVTSNQHNLIPNQNKSNQIDLCNHRCTNKLTKHFSSPIIIEKKINSKKLSVQIPSIPQKPKSITKSNRGSVKKVQQFIPVDIPTRDKKLDSNEYMLMPRAQNKQIQIRIQKDQQDNENMKKLIKKINKLNDDLTEAQKNNSKLYFQLQNYRDIQNKNRQHQKIIHDLELANHKLQLQIATLKQKLAYQKSKPPQTIQKIVQKPFEVIKHIPIEKIVEVKVQVPKFVAGPERIIQKFIEVPKYIQVQKKIPMQIIKQVIKQVPHQVIKTVLVPQYIQKPVYVDKIVEVPIQVPVYIDRPIFENDTNLRQQLSKLNAKIGDLEYDVKIYKEQNDDLRRQNSELLRSLQLLRRHNQQKNRQVQNLLHNNQKNQRFSDVLIKNGNSHYNGNISNIYDGSYSTNYYSHYRR